MIQSQTNKLQINTMYSQEMPQSPTNKIVSKYNIKQGNDSITDQ